MKKLQDFFATKWGVAVAFLVLFYLMTFAVYYFYSPGPKERMKLAGEGSTMQYVPVDSSSMQKK